MSMSLTRQRKRMSINDVKLPSEPLKGLSVEMLKELSKQDDATFFQFFEGLNLENVKTAREKSTQIREENKALAVETLELEPKFEGAKSKLLERSSEYTVLKEEYDKNFLKLKEIQDKMNHQAVEKELAQMVKKTEQESEDLASDFIGGKSPLNLEEFADKFIELRTLFWLRKVKSGKMKDLLNNYKPSPTPRTLHGSASQSSSLHSLSSTHHASDPSASLPPYPVTNSMPQPHAQPFPAAAYKRTPPTKPAAYAGLGPNRFQYK